MKVLSNYLINDFQATNVTKQTSIPKLFKLSILLIALKPNLDFLLWFKYFILPGPPVSSHHHQLCTWLPTAKPRHSPSLYTSFSSTSFRQTNSITICHVLGPEKEKHSPSPPVIYRLVEKTDFEYNCTATKKKKKIIIEMHVVQK